MALNTKGTERELKIQRTWNFFVNYKKREKNTKKQLLPALAGTETADADIADGASPQYAETMADVDPAVTPTRPAARRTIHIPTSANKGKSVTSADLDMPLPPAFPVGASGPRNCYYKPASQLSPRRNAPFRESGTLWPRILPICEFGCPGSSGDKRRAEWRAAGV